MMIGTVQNALVSCVSKARLKLLDIDENWIKDRKSEIVERTIGCRMRSQKRRNMRS